LRFNPAHRFQPYFGQKPVALVPAMIATRSLLPLILAFAFIAAPAAQAQQEERGLFPGLFGRREQPPQNVPQGDSELMIRIERLENQLRQLTGLVEQLQYQNQQLQQRLGANAPADAPPQRGPQRPPQQQPQPQPQAAPPQLPPPQQPPQNRRGDAFDPDANPDAPGRPRNLGVIQNQNQPPSRQPDAPMDLNPNAGPNPQGPNVPPQATLPPSSSPKDEYDLAYGYILRKDYALAEQSFRAFLARHSDDRNVPQAAYWLGESLFAQNKHSDAAEVFLDVYNKYPNSQRVPDALLRLGQSLAVLGKKEAACASLGAVLSKYPKASPTVRKNATDEQKRLGC
jgi:tol-pal system protein YbgF